MITNTVSPHSLIQQLLEAIGDDADLRVEWQAAMRAAARESLQVLLQHGALSDSDSFYNAVTRVADEGFDFGRLDSDLSSVLESLPTDQRLQIDEISNGAEYAKWRGAYALGLAVGIRLAGGAR
jgi:hypothetical protein